MQMPRAASTQWLALIHDCYCCLVSSVPAEVTQYNKHKGNCQHKLNWTAGCLVTYCVLVAGRCSVQVGLSVPLKTCWINHFPDKMAWLIIPVIPVCLHKASTTARPFMHTPLTVHAYTYHPPKQANTKLHSLTVKTHHYSNLHFLHHGIKCSV